MGVGKPPMTSTYKVPGTAVNRPLMSSMGRGVVPMSRGAGMPGSRMGLTTAQGGGGGPGEARPMTSVSGAGYQGGVKENRSFDPLNIGKGPAPPLAEKSENSSEDKAKELEKQVHRLIEASADAVASKDYMKALEKVRTCVLYFLLLPSTCTYAPTHIHTHTHMQYKRPKRQERRKEDCASLEKVMGW